MIKMNVFKMFFKSRDKPDVKNSYIGSSFLGGISASGKSVNEHSAMQVTAVYACVRVISETIASLPLQVFKYTEIGKEKAVNHALYGLLHDEPNPEMTSFVFRETMMSHLLLFGNAYAQILRNGKGEVTALYLLMPSQMTVNRASNGQIYYTYNKIPDDGFKNKSTQGGNQYYLKPSDVLHIPGLGFDGLVGYSPISMARNAIGMAISTEEYGAKFFANGAKPGGVLEHPGTLKNPEKIRESWNTLFRGSGNSHGTAILEEGLQYKPIGVSPNEAQFLETRKFQTNEIARIFRVPPHLIGDLERATFSNIEHESISFVDNTIVPWVTRLEQSMQKSLLRDSEKQDFFIKFNLTARLRGDANSRASFYQTMRQNGIMSANDIRSLEQMNLIPKEDGGFKYFVNGSMVDMASAGVWTQKYTNEGGEKNGKIENTSAGENA